MAAATAVFPLPVVSASSATGRSRSHASASSWCDASPSGRACAAKLLVGASSCYRRLLGVVTEHREYVPEGHAGQVGQVGQVSQPFPCVREGGKQSRRETAPAAPSCWQRGAGRLGRPLRRLLAAALVQRVLPLLGLTAVTPALRHPDRLCGRSVLIRANRSPAGGGATAPMFSTGPGCATAMISRGCRGGCTTAVSSTGAPPAR